MKKGINSLPQRLPIIRKRSPKLRTNLICQKMGLDLGTLPRMPSRMPLEGCPPRVSPRSRILPNLLGSVVVQEEEVSLPRMQRRPTSGIRKHQKPKLHSINPKILMATTSEGERGKGKAAKPNLQTPTLPGKHLGCGGGSKAFFPHSILT